MSVSVRFLLSLFSRSQLLASESDVGRCDRTNHSQVSQHVLTVTSQSLHKLVGNKLRHPPIRLFFVWEESMEFFDPRELTSGPGRVVHAVEHLLVPKPQLVAAGRAREAMDALRIHDPLVTPHTLDLGENAGVFQT